MTITTTQSRISYAGDNVTTGFPIPFEFFLNSDITAVKTAVGGGIATLVLNVDYTLTGANVPTGGSLSKTTALLTGESLAIFLNPPFTQQSHYISNAPFPAATLENDIDRQTQVSQRLSDLLTRSIRFPDADPNAASALLPSAIVRALTNLGFDAAGNVALNQVLAPGTLSAASIGGFLYPQTAAEAAAGITPVSYQYAPGTAWRYETAAQITDWLAGTGIYNHGPLIQNAVNTKQPVFLPPGTPSVLTAVTVTTPGQRIYGAGLATVIKVPATFNLAAQGVFIFNCATQPSAELEDFWISFVQPDVAVFASLTQYPPALYAQNQPRFKMRKMRITNAIVCVDMSANSGGSSLEQCELCHYLTGVKMIGTEFDTIRLTDVHFWPFGPPGTAEITVNQQVIYNTQANIGIVATNVNELFMSGVVFLCGLGMQIAETSNFQMWANLVNVAFDTGSGINMSGGEIFMAGGFFSQSNAANYAVTQTGGFLVIDDVYFVAGNATTNIIVNANDAAIPAVRLTISNSLMSGIVAGQQFLTANTTSGQTFINFTGNHFSYLPQNSTVANPIVAITGANTVISFTDNVAFNKGTGAGNLLSIGADNYHVITGNQFEGWGCAIPAGATQTLFSGNTLCANNGTPVLSTNKGTGTFTAATSVVVTHGVNFNGAAPPVSAINFTPTSDPGAGIRVWVSATSATTFTVSTSAAATFTFAWQVTNPNLT